jgi:hypothetical protein
MPVQDGPLTVQFYQTIIRFSVVFLFELNHGEPCRRRLLFPYGWWMAWRTFDYLLTGLYLANWFSICRLVLLVVYYFDMDDEWHGEPLNTCYMCSMTTFVSYSITFPHKLYFVGICDLIGNSIPSDLKATNHLLSIFLEVCQLSKENWI